jgi:hypothetical protein
MKNCIKCGESKPVTDFGRVAKMIDGRNSTCMMCMAVPRKAPPEKHYADYLRDAGMTEAYKRCIKTR